MATFTDLSGNQQKLFVDIEQVYGAYLDAAKQLHRYPGWMLWKKVSGKEYLFHAFDRSGGTGKGLGRRSPETESQKSQFDAEKQRLADLIDGFKERLKEYSIATRAYRLRRLPTTAAKIVREIDDRELLGSSLIVVGTNALFAYEAAAGCQFFPDYTATRDLDLLWEARQSIELGARDRIEPDGFLGLLKSIDKTFTRNEELTFQAVNRDAYLVDLLKPIGAQTDRMTSADKIDPMELEGQQWLLDCERFEQTVIADDGYPARIICPDPRIFVLHKFWMSELRNRKPPKARRDKLQAQAVKELLDARFPHLHFGDIEKHLPKALANYLKVAKAARGIRS